MGGRSGKVNLPLKNSLLASPVDFSAYDLDFCGHLARNSTQIRLIDLRRHSTRSAAGELSALPPFASVDILRLPGPIGRIAPVANITMKG